MFSIRLWALTKKEILQLLRDPSSIIIAFVLPAMLLFLFGYGLSFDAKDINIGIVLEDQSPIARDMANCFLGSRFFITEISASRQDMLQKLYAEKLKSVLVIPQGTAASMISGNSASLQLLTDGAFPNAGNMIQSYALLTVQKWALERAYGTELFSVEPRFRYNNELTSRYSLIPGIMALIMALIGTMMTALVVAREWERGTMEALFATPASAIELLLGKLIPYYLLAIFSTFFSLFIAVNMFSVPFRGSLFALFCVASVFMTSALGQGLIISTVTKNQYLASFTALLSAFMPVIMLSGFLFEINAMPLLQRAIAAIFPARHLVTCLQTLFLAGNIWPLLISGMIKMALIGMLFLGITLRKTKKTLM